MNNFYGRENIIKDMKEKLDDSSAVVVSAMGGCGKTQTVAKFVQNHQDEFDNIFWLVASNIKTTLQEIVGELTSSMRLRNQQENLTVLQLSQRISTLTRGKKVLYVVDDVFEGDLENLKILLRNVSTSSKFLITTQLSDVCGIIASSKIKSIIFPQFTDEESKTFLRMNILQASDEEIEKLSSELKAFPLCLQQAVAYINKHNTPILAYIKSFKECKKPILDPKKTYSDYDRTLLTVWSVALDKVKASPKAFQILAMMSMMDNSCIRKETFLYDKDIVEDEFELNEIIDNLCEYSLVQTTGDRLFIHALVQKVIRIYLEANEFHLNGNLVRIMLHGLLLLIANGSNDLRDIDKKNLWYIHFIKLHRSVVQFEEDTINLIIAYKLTSEVAFRRADMKTYLRYFEKECDLLIQFYRDHKKPLFFLEALKRYNLFISLNILTDELVSKLNSIKKEFESEFEYFRNEDAICYWKGLTYPFTNSSTLLKMDLIVLWLKALIKNKKESKRLQMLHDNDDLSLEDHYDFYCKSVQRHLGKRHCNEAKAVLDKLKKLMTDNDFPMGQSHYRFEKQYYEARILFLEGNYSGALNLLTDIPVNNLGLYSVPILKACILMKLRRFNKARDCLPTDDECKRNIPFLFCLACIQFMRNNFNELKALLRGYDFDITFYFHLYAMAWVQFNERRHSLTIEREAEIVFYLVKFKGYINEQFENRLFSR